MRIGTHLFTLALGAIICSATVAQDVGSGVLGHYKNKNRQQDTWIKLNEDGTYKYYLGSRNYKLNVEGTYEVVNDTVYLERDLSKTYGPHHIANKYNRMLVMDNRLLWSRNATGGFSGANAMVREEE